MVMKKRLICWFGLLSVIFILANMTLLLCSEAEFTPTGSLEKGRFAHTATLLSNGKVLIVGGVSNVYLTSAELYDPETGTFSPTGSLGTPRILHTATLLPSGKVLIAGGCSGAYPMTTYLSAELYDPVTGTFSPTGNMGISRAAHTATLLSNGEVLIASGQNQWDISSTNSAELYDPDTSIFKPTGSLMAYRGIHRAVLLPNGKVLITGGGNIFSSAELYDPSTGTFAFTGSMAVGRNYHTATLLPNGKVLIAAGEGWSRAPLDNAELYDPATGTFLDACCTQVPRERHTATLLPSGKVLLTGTGPGWPGEPGHPLSPIDAASAELYDPAMGTFSPTGSMVTGRFFHTATLLPSGKVLIVGGADVNGVFLASAELYWDPTNVPNYTVTFIEGMGGTISGCKIQTVAEGGDSTPVQAVPNYSYIFDNWTGTGYFSSMENPLTVYNVTTDMIITAHFKLDQIDVLVDVKPGDTPNSINPRSKGKIPVAIIAALGYSADDIDPVSVRFGKTGSETYASNWSLCDVNDDGQLDLMLHFPTQNTGIHCGDTKVLLTGKTRNGVSIVGEDDIQTVGCK